MLDEILLSEDGNYRVVAEIDDNPENPRNNENIGVMVCGHRRYTLGDRSDLLDGLVGQVHDGLAIGEMRRVLEVLRDEHGTTVVLPLYLTDHSGLSMSAGDNLLIEGATTASNGWDTGLVGIIFDVDLKTSGIEWMLDDAEAVLRAEVRDYDLYLRGEVYDLRVQMKVIEHVTTVARYPAGSEEVHQRTDISWVDLDDEPHATVYGDAELGMIAADLLSDCLV